MDWQRSLLIAGMLVVLYMLFLEWDTFQSSQQENQSAVSEETVLAPETAQIPSDTTPTSANNEIPALQNDTSPVTPTSVESTVPETTTDRLLSVSTDVLNVLIDTRGGDIVRVALPEHLTELEEDSSPFFFGLACVLGAAPRLADANHLLLAGSCCLSSVVPSSDTFAILDMSVSFSSFTGEVLVIRCFFFGFVLILVSKEGNSLGSLITPGPLCEDDILSL